jgi:hypothetical protein
MNYKAHIIRGLLYFYPEKWRIEYGEELDALLLSRPLSAAIISDVLLNGLQQRLRELAPWKVTGALLFAWTIIGLIWNSATPFSPVWFSRYCVAISLFLLLGGCWTTLRSPTTISKAAWLTTKAALVSIIPEVFVCLLWAAKVVRPSVLDLSGLPSLHASQMTLLYFRGSIMLSPIQDLSVLFGTTLVEGWVMGLVGATLGSLAIRFIPGIRRD